MPGSGCWRIPNRTNASIKGSTAQCKSCNIDIRLDQLEQSITLAVADKVPVSCFIFYDEIFRQTQLANLDGLPRVKRDPGNFRQKELRVDFLALLDVGDYSILAFFPIELVNNQSSEAEQSSGRAPLFDVLIQRFKFLRPGLQVIIFIHQHVNRIAVSMTPHHPVDPAHQTVVLLHRRFRGLLFIHLFLFAEQKTPQTGHSIVNVKTPGLRYRRIAGRLINIEQKIRPRGQKCLFYTCVTWLVLTGIITTLI